MYYTRMLITLPAIAKDITVTVSDGTNPVASATVTAGTITGTTGSDGKVVLDDVPETVTSITATKTGYTSVTESVTIDASHTSFTITIEPVDTLTVTVDDGTDAIEGASVKIGTTTKTTGEDGKCTFPDMTFQDYSAEVSATGYTTTTETLSFRSNHKAFTVSLEAAQEEENPGTE